MKILKTIIKGLIPLLIVFMGLLLQVFCVWQWDIMFVSRMWGSALENIEFYQGLIRDGFYSYAASNYFTINVHLFPQGMFTTGFWYDALMGMIILGWFISITAMYIFHSEIVKKVKYLKTILRKVGKRLTLC